jgi:prolyl oligopeptidase
MLSSRNIARRFALPLVVLWVLSVSGTWPRALADEPIAYPKTKTVDVVDDYHGVEVADPYRWLEDDNAKDTEAWVQAQNKITFDFMRRIVGRGPIGERITKLYDRERCRLPQERGGRYFFRKNNGLQNQDVLYTMNAIEDKPRVLLDPNKLSKDGTIAVSSYEPSEDGKLLAYSLSEDGSDWVEFKVRNVNTGEDLSDHLKWIKFSGASWTHDSKGFFYGRYDEPKTKEELTGANYYKKLYYHTIGTPQSQDKLVYENPEEKEWSISGEVTDDGRYLIISIAKGTQRKNRVGDGSSLSIQPLPRARTGRRSSSRTKTCCAGRA